MDEKLTKDQAPLRLCLVDDDPIIVYTTKALVALRQDVDKLISCSNGKEAFKYLQQCHKGLEPMPDVLLLDLNMPVWDGWNFLDEYKTIANGQSPVIYILSSSDLYEDIDRAKRYSIVSGFLSKPLTELMLNDIVQTINSES